MPPNFDKSTNSYGNDPTQGNRFQMFWYDGPLNWIARLSIKSFTRFTGTTLYVYSYDAESDPHVEGCKWMDAEEIVPQSDLREYKENLGYAEASDLFRYRLLYTYGGWYFDTDCLLIKSLAPFFDKDFVFARQDEELVCSSVMKFPKNHPMLDEMYKECIEFGPRKYGWPMLGRFSPKKYRWGMFGPNMFTKHLKRTPLIHKALPPESFYPIHWSSISRFASPYTPDDRTYIVHLWNEIWRRMNLSASYLDPSFLALSG